MTSNKDCVKAMLGNLVSRIILPIAIVGTFTGTISSPLKLGSLKLNVQCYVQNNISTASSSSGFQAWWVPQIG